MKYLLLIYGNEANMRSASKAASEQMHGAYIAYTEAMKKAGVIVGGERLRPTNSASSVRVANGKTQVLDGPYAETKEQLGGYYMIEVPDLDAALSWAARCPGAAHGTIAVRPVGPMRRRARGVARGPRPRYDRIGGAKELRQAGRLPRGAHQRRRGGGGRVVRRLRGCAFGLAGERTSRQPGGVADGGGTAQADRRGAA